MHDTHVTLRLVAEEDEDKVRALADALKSRGYKTCVGGLQPAEESASGSSSKAAGSDKKDSKKEGKKLSHIGSVAHAISSAAAVCLCLSVSISLVSPAAFKTHSDEC